MHVLLDCMSVDHKYHQYLQKTGDLAPLEQELKMFVSHHVGAEN